MKFNKKIKKGFTLVELIVVIAIVAILAAVSVVSYIAFINSANESADVQLVKQLNTCLQADEALHGKKDWTSDYSGLRQLLESNGFIVENLTKTKSGCDMVYQGKIDDDHIINRYALLNGDKVIYSETTFAESNNCRNLWIPDTLSEAETLTAAGKGVVLGEELGDINTFNAKGSVIVDGANVNHINYSNNGASQNVVIRTSTFTTKLSIDGYVDPSDYTKGDTIAHYGYSGLISVKKCALSSFDEYGAVGRLTANSQDAIGHIAIKNGATAFQVVEADGDNSFVTVDSNATVFKNDGTKVSGSVDTRSTGGHDDLFVTDADEDCEHNSTHIVSDGQYLYEVCDTCGYTVISVIDSTTGETKRNVVDSNGQETIVPMSTYTVDGTNVSIDDNGRVVLGNNAEPTIATPVVDKNQPITHFEHNFGPMVIITAATTEEKGLGKYTCTECGFSYTVDIPQLSCIHEYHSIEEVKANIKDLKWLELSGKTFAPTCLEDGIIGEGYCKKCGQDVKGTIVKALGHDNHVHEKDVDLTGLGINDGKLHTIDFESAYCKRCDSPIAFVDKCAFNLTDGSKTLDATYSFKTFSKERIKIDGKESEYTVFDLMYSDDLDKSDETVIELANLVFGDALSYTNWNADFEIYFNYDVQGEDFYLGGAYGSLKMMIDPTQFGVNNLTAFQTVPFLGGENSFLTYGSILEGVREFYCGIANNGIKIPEGAYNEILGAPKAYVGLYIYNPDNGAKKLICMTPYEFRDSRENRYITASEFLENFEYEENAVYKIELADGTVFYSMDTGNGYEIGELDDIINHDQFFVLVLDKNGKILNPITESDAKYVDEVNWESVTEQFKGVYFTEDTIFGETEIPAESLGLLVGSDLVLYSGGETVKTNNGIVLTKLNAAVVSLSD